jgi:acetamidase/formamidase
VLCFLARQIAHPDARDRGSNHLVAVHEIPTERSTLHGHFSRELEPVLTIEPGDSIVLRALNSAWILEPGVVFDPRDPELDAGHALIGPVEVRGARAGQTLVVQIDDVRPGRWGGTPSFGTDRVVRWELDPDAGVGRDDRGRTVVLHPFLGVLGMPPPELGRHSTIPPRRWGGNIDCKELVRGARLFLPIPVDGALFSAGDGHARQGDGEVGSCAIECPIEARLTLDVRDDMTLEWPIARTPDAWLTFGFDEDLDEAARIATEGMLDLFEREHGIERADALALASVVADLRVTQVVNGAKGVHAVLPHDAIGFTTIS